MDWRAVCGGLFRGDFDCADSIGRGHRPHRNDHAAAERTGRRRLDSRAIHRDGEVLFDMPERNPGGQQRLLEGTGRSEEHTSELQSLMRISYAGYCLQKKITNAISYTLMQVKENSHHLVCLIIVTMKTDKTCEKLDTLN